MRSLKEGRKPVKEGTWTGGGAFVKARIFGNTRESAF
jgi:hypothetical protein